VNCLLIKALFSAPWFLLNPSGFSPFLDIYKRPTKLYISMRICVIGRKLYRSWIKKQKILQKMYWLRYLQVAEIHSKQLLDQQLLKFVKLFKHNYFITCIFVSTRYNGETKIPTIKKKFPQTSSISPLLAKHNTGTIEMVEFNF
jgi:hypothetical protein